MGGPIDYEKALLDPQDFFDDPEEVLDHPELTKAQKIEILRRWEYDANEVAVAEEEGMVGSDPPLMLRRVLLALDKLTGGTGGGQTSPTKHNGV